MIHKIINEIQYVIGLKVQLYVIVYTYCLYLVHFAVTQWGQNCYEVTLQSIRNFCVFEFIQKLRNFLLDGFMMKLRMRLHF